MTKVCTDCLDRKEISEFGKAPENADKLRGACKECYNAKQRERRKSRGYDGCKKYEKTPNGFIMRMYRNMLSRISGIQKEKFHLYEGKELMPKEEFYAWVKQDKDFISLFAAYEKSGYERKLAPSPDRIKSELGYMIGNIRIITHSHNSSLGSLSKGTKGDIEAYKDGVLVGTYAGLAKCQKATGVHESQICNVIQGKHKQAGGFTFKRIPK